MTVGSGVLYIFILKPKNYKSTAIQKKYKFKNVHLFDNMDTIKIKIN